MKPGREVAPVSRRPASESPGHGRRAAAVVPARRLAAALALVAIAAAAAAQDSKDLGKFGHWSAYAVNAASEPMCYVASAPVKEEGKYQSRGKVWALVSHLRSREPPGEVQFVAGYRFKKGSVVEVVIDNKTTFTLFTDDGDAWPYNGEDRDLIEAMKRGLNMVVRGTSWRDTETADSYSLSGFTAAYNEATAACNIR